MQEFSLWFSCEFFFCCSIWRFLFMFFFLFLSIRISGIAKHWGLVIECGYTAVQRFKAKREFENWIISSKFQFPYQCVCRAGDGELGETACVPRWACFCERHWGETPNSGQLCKMSFHLVNGTTERTNCQMEFYFYFSILLCVQWTFITMVAVVVPILHEVEISISHFFFVCASLTRIQSFRVLIAELKYFFGPSVHSDGWREKAKLK